MRHLVFADCAQLCDAAGDAAGLDLFSGLAYGIYPVGVHEDRGHLVFRRLVPADQRDRQRRVTEASEALQALPGLRRYHAALANPNDELHVDAATNSVAWPLAAARADHLAVVPELVGWTRWEGDAPWHALRAAVAASAAAATPPTYSGLPRHLKLAQVLDFVGRRAADAGRDPAEECGRASVQFALALLVVTVGPGGVGVVDVAGY